MQTGFPPVTIIKKLEKSLNKESRNHYFKSSLSRTLSTDILDDQMFYFQLLLLAYIMQQQAMQWEIFPQSSRAGLQLDSAVSLSSFPFNWCE